MDESPQEALDAIDAAAKVVQSVPNASLDVIELSNGVKLRIKAVPIMTLRHAVAVIRKPEPPMVESPGREGRMEPWEGDPRYQEELGRWEYQMSETTLNVMLGLGTKPEYIPEDIDKPDGTDWVELLESVEVPLKLNSGPARYLSWLRFYVLSNTADIAKVSEAVARRSGVLETDVSEAQSSFRGGENGRANPEPAAPQHRADGNNVPTPIGGTGSGSRREG